MQSPDGKYLASGAIDGIINIFDIATGKLLHTLEGKAWNACSRLLSISGKWSEASKYRGCALLSSLVFRFPAELLLPMLPETVQERSWSNRVAGVGAVQDVISSGLHG